jgi:membrane fusion protein (multidrug efflux system)
LVAIIDDSDYKVKYEQAEANYQKALLNQNVAQANLKAVNSSIELARKDLERYKNLYQTGAVSKQVLDAAQTKFDNVKAQQETAEQAILSKAKDKVADADLKALKALRDKAQLELSYTKIYAPQSGNVTNKKLEKGAYLQVGQPLFALVPDEVWVVANFKENQVGEMKVGQAVDIKIDAYPNTVFKGKIESIQRASGAKSSLFPPENAVGSFVKIVQRIPVKIVFDEPIDTNKYNVVSGMSVVPKVRVK